MEKKRSSCNVIFFDKNLRPVQKIEVPHASCRRLRCFAYCLFSCPYIVTALSTWLGCNLAIHLLLFFLLEVNGGFSKWSGESFCCLHGNITQKKVAGFTSSLGPAKILGKKACRPEISGKVVLHFFSDGFQGERHGGMAGNLGLTHFHGFLVYQLFISIHVFLAIPPQELQAWYGRMTPCQQISMSSPWNFGASLLQYGRV